MKRQCYIPCPWYTKKQKKKTQMLEERLHDDLPSDDESGDEE